MKLNFVTGNANKFAVAKSICNLHDIDLEQLVLDIDEIQGEDPEVIIRDKAKKAFEIVGKPIVVSDDSWHFSALNGFPGAYMKSINHWFTPQDFLNLLRDKDDRSAIIIKLLAFYDGKEMIIFRKDSAGQISHIPRGESEIPLRRVYVSDHDDGLTLAELDNNGLIDSPERVKKQPEPWHDLAQWITTNLS